MSGRGSSLTLCSPGRLYSQPLFLSRHVLRSLLQACQRYEKRSAGIRPFIFLHLSFSFVVSRPPVKLKQTTAMRIDAVLSGSRDFVTRLLQRYHTPLNNGFVVPTVAETRLADGCPASLYAGSVQNECLGVILARFHRKLVAAK